MPCGSSLLMSGIPLAGFISGSCLWICPERARKDVSGKTVKKGAVAGGGGDARAF